MGETPEPPYKVDRLSTVGDRLKKLSEIATAAGFRQRYFDALIQMVEYLQSKPLEWGDPKNRTRHKGGLICQAILPPINVHYVVFEAERSVCILKVDLLPQYLPEHLDS
jgi:hypothetical protein